MSKPRVLSSVPAHMRAGKSVTWREGYMPLTTPFRGVGVVFLSSGKTTYVTWPDIAKPVVIATVALVLV